VLGRAQARRERYVGPWLPEPLVEDIAAGDPADRVTLDESVSMALLVVLERLTPAARTSFLLHDVFGLSFAEIGGVVGRIAAIDVVRNPDKLTGVREPADRPGPGIDETGWAASRRTEFARRPGSAKVLERTSVSAGDAGRPSTWGGRADVAQLVEHHLAKVRVAGSNPVVRSEAPDAVYAAEGPHGSRDRFSPGDGAGSGGVAEWLRQGPAKPCTRVRFPPPPRGRLAQWESATLTR
jgi:hypothetical protein